MRKRRAMCLQIHKGKYHIDMGNAEVQPTTISI